MTRLGVGVNDGTSVESAALRFRNGVTGRAGFLNSGEAPLVLGAALAVRDFLTDRGSVTASADRFFASGSVPFVGVARLELETLVERRRDILNLAVLIIHQQQHNERANGS